MGVFRQVVRSSSNAARPIASVNVFGETRKDLSGHTTASGRMVSPFRDNIGTGRLPSLC
jgi:hypothetical protein